MPLELDSIDLKILEILQGDAGRPVSEIADLVGLSSSPCWRRIKRLEDEGVISGRVTLLDFDKLGLKFEVIASVKLQLPTRENLERFEQAAMSWPQVLDCATVTGQWKSRLQLEPEKAPSADPAERSVSAELARAGRSRRSRESSAA